MALNALSCHFPESQIPSPLGESRVQAVRRFLSLECALHAKGQFDELKTVMNEYFDSEHAEVVPEADLDKIRFLPPHAHSSEGV